MNNDQNNTDIGQLIELSKQATYNINAIGKEMGLLHTELQDVKVGYRQLATDVKNLNEDLQQYKEFNADSQYLRPEQQQELHVAAKARVAELLTPLGEDAFRAYFGKFMSRFWNDAKNARILIGTKGMYTPQRNFEPAKRYINAWTPYKYGVEGYIDHLRKRVTQLRF